MSIYYAVDQSLSIERTALADQPVGSSMLALSFGVKLIQNVRKISFQFDLIIHNSSISDRLITGNSYLLILEILKFDFLPIMINLESLPIIAVAFLDNLKDKIKRIYYNYLIWRNITSTRVN